MGADSKKKKRKKTKAKRKKTEERKRELLALSLIIFELGQMVEQSKSPEEAALARRMRMLAMERKSASRLHCELQVLELRLEAQEVPRGEGERGESVAEEREELGCNEQQLLESLPRDVLVIILGKCEVRDIRALACCSKFWSELISRSSTGERVWADACLQMWGSGVDFPVNSWKWTFYMLRQWTWASHDAQRVGLSNFERTALRLEHEAGIVPSAVICRATIDPEYCYWSVRVDKMCADGITIGVASFESLSDHRLGSSQESYGYNSFATLWHQNVRVPYGKRYVEGDTIGVHLDFEKRRLEFYLNGDFLNYAAHEQWLATARLHLAATLSYPGDQITLLKPAHRPPKKKRGKR